MTIKWLITILIFSGPVHAEVNYRELCATFMEVEAPLTRPILPDSRSAQEIVATLDDVTREFRELHPEFEVSSTFATAETDATKIEFGQQSALEIVDHLFKNVRFANQVDQGLHVMQDTADFSAFKGWIVQQTLWRAHPFMRPEWSKSVRFSAALAPSKEFQTLKGLTGASGSIFKREIEVLRYHPSVMVFIPVSVLKLAKLSLREEFPEVDYNIKTQIMRRDQKFADEQRASFQFYNAPSYHDVFTQTALLKLLRALKKDVDEVVGSKTSWSIGARTRENTELTELIVKIDHVKVETAWRASLEFTNRYALALEKKVPLKTPAPEAFPAPSYIPALSAPDIRQK